jgi:hypothetical protein
LRYIYREQEERKPEYPFQKIYWKLKRKICQIISIIRSKQLQKLRFYLNF